MQSSILTTAFLPLTVAVVMFGLGLALRVSDFARVARHPRATVIALGCQTLVLPSICLGLVLLFDLDAPLAVGAPTVPPSAMVPLAPPPIVGVGPTATAASGVTSLPSIATLPRSEASVRGRVPASETMPSLRARLTSPGCSLVWPRKAIWVPPPVSVRSSALSRYCAGASPLPRAR